MPEHSYIPTHLRQFIGTTRLPTKAEDRPSRLAKVEDYPQDRPSRQTPKAKGSPTAKTLTTSLTSVKPRSVVGPVPSLSIAPIIHTSIDPCSVDERDVLQSRINHLEDQLSLKEQWLEGWVEWKERADQEARALRDQIPPAGAIVLTTGQMRELFGHGLHNQQPSQQSNHHTVDPHSGGSPLAMASPNRQCSKCGQEFRSPNALFNHIYSNSCVSHPGQPTSREDTTSFLPARPALEVLPHRLPSSGSDGVERLQPPQIRSTGNAAALAMPSLLTTTRLPVDRATASPPVSQTVASQGVATQTVGSGALRPAQQIATAYLKKSSEIDCLQQSQPTAQISTLSSSTSTARPSSEFDRSQ
ncbi:hypothetical protein QBC42DRAFT_311064 [Cladorrhinum samala]|uniref:C2H2-type domain-containing protein n=1 Tax=Cladorrhinum samala TaxID=585594 RepID=A0AAV9HFL6_9PEZI|nr:hypothetical protein QBC42DRAFT_311064 [Cladorrhinum samala]